MPYDGIKRRAALRARSGRKVTPLKTVAQLKVDLELAQQERDLARADLLAVTLERDQIKSKVLAEREGLAVLFTDIRNLAVSDNPEAVIPFDLKWRTVLSPSFMLKRAIEQTKTLIWQQITGKLDEHERRKGLPHIHTEACYVRDSPTPGVDRLVCRKDTKATTVRVEKAGPTLGCYGCDPQLEGRYLHKESCPHGK